MRSIDVGIVMGSDSDEPIMTGARTVLERFRVPFASKVCSAHRTADDVPKIAASWVARGCKVIIAGAGCSAQLAGAFAAHTIIPVIGVPLTNNVQSAVNGLDALLATAQMPEGIPISTMAINGAGNAAYQAISILALSDPELHRMLLEYRATLISKTRRKAKKLHASGWPE